MRSIYDRVGIPYKHEHPPGGRCPMEGRVIGGDQTELWNSARVLHMEVLNDTPTFNWTRNGKAVNLKMINDTILFLIQEASKLK
jgi:hypothetical protein